MGKDVTERKPGPINYWAWGSGDVVGAGLPAVTSGWLIYFYTTFCHIDALKAGGLLAIPRIFDAITCPLIGYISDNLRHTWVGRHIGRRKIFLLIAIPLLPSFALMWVQGQSFLYYLSSYIFFELVYNCVLIPWETLPAEMSKDYKVKAKFAGARMLQAQAFAIFASYLPTLIINHLGKDSAVTFLINGAIFGVMGSILITLAVIFTWERPYTDGEKLIKPEPLNLARGLMIPFHMFRDLFSTLRIRAFRQHLGIYLGGYISQDVFNAAFPIFVLTVMLGATQIISQMWTIMYAVQLLSVLIAINVVMRTGPQRAYAAAIASFILACVLYYIYYLIQPAGFPAALHGIEHNVFGGVLSGKVGPMVIFWLFVPVALAGLGRGTLNFVPWSVYNYLPDVDEAVTGQRREGIFAGVMTLVRKFTQAFALAGTGWAMEAGGFVSGAPTQTPHAVHTIVLILCVAPAVVMLLGFLVSLSFRLNAKTHDVLMTEIERLRDGATEPATPESGKVVEDLTGWTYAQLWGRGR
ncbi:MAG: MFS transporter [Asticcacaulis sp.]|uniref:MFS transporter n=1 Tax=Asticcacaulis sp. TaxID=1872648 RepID=UPI003F7C9FA4